MLKNINYELVIVNNCNFLVEIPKNSIPLQPKSQPDVYQNIQYAEIAQLVEHDLAKVGVAGPSPVFRSRSPRWWNGRHEGLKIPWSEMAVRVRVPLAARIRFTREESYRKMVFLLIFYK